MAHQSPARHPRAGQCPGAFRLCPADSPAFWHLPVWLVRLLAGAGPGRTGGPFQGVDCGHFLVIDAGLVCRYRCLWQNLQRPGILCCGSSHSGRLQRHGHGCGLDECRLVHQFVGQFVFAGIFWQRRPTRRLGLCAGLDWRFLPLGHAGGTPFAPPGHLHLARLLCAAFWRPVAAAYCGGGRHFVLVYLCGGADLRRWFDYLALDRTAFRNRHFAKSSRGISNRGLEPVMLGEILREVRL